MDIENRKKQLYEKSIADLIDMIIRYEQEIENTKVYRATLVRIKSMLTPPDERRGKGRPAKGEEVL